nr:uncharacterized protein LOC122274034 [Parasteatoda tepidariorum]
MACLGGYQKPRSESIGSFEAYRDLQIPSSVDLLRASIVKSIRKRVYDNQGFLERKFDGSDNKPAQYSGPKYTVVEVSPSQTIDDAESDLSDTERKDATNEENTQLIQRTNSSERNVPNSNTSDEPEKSLSINSDKSSFQNSNEEKLTDDWLVITDKKEVTDDQKGTEMNNFILARRKFNNSIFQDCSTYDITCPTAHLNEVNDKCSQLSNSQNNSSYVHSYSTTDSISLCSSEDYLSICSDKNNIHTGSANLNEHGEDHTALCDTFFTHVVSEEQSEVNPLFSSEQPITNCKSSLTERDLNIAEQSESEIEVAKHDEPPVMPAKRKFSRRHRKRSRKRTKSKKSYVYECTKCGVSYCIPTKAMNNVACCLHCDLWTPVEPVFVRREKTTWNTCRVS